MFLTLAVNSNFFLSSSFFVLSLHIFSYFFLFYFFFPECSRSRLDRSWHLRGAFYVSEQKRNGNRPATVFSSPHVNAHTYPYFIFFSFCSCMCGFFSPVLRGPEPRVQRPRFIIFFFWFPVVYNVTIFRKDTKLVKQWWCRPCARRAFFFFFSSAMRGRLLVARWSHPPIPRITTTRARTKEKEKVNSAAKSRVRRWPERWLSVVRALPGIFI